VIHPALSSSIAALAATFGAESVTHTACPDGSVWVTVAGVDLGVGWRPTIVDLSVKLAPTFPDTAPYPWYLPANLVRADGVVVDRLSDPAQIDGVCRRQLSLNAPWATTDSLPDRMVAVIRWLRKWRSVEGLAS